ncbi:hypothetical protein, partial [uncultured Maribacter sp.]|uniref:hypothetical protein n=1 Tax=uncultured Maribacter sp. TaxID=431308 RepID=UPI0026083672
MKLIITTLFFSFCFCLSSYGQIKIGDNPQTIDASSVLELESTSHVLVITRVTTTQMEAITPSPGGMVYNIDEECIHYYTGTAWINLCEAGGISNLTTDPLVNDFRTIVITPQGDINHIEVGIIRGEQIADNSIDTSKLGENSVTANELSDNSVGTNELQDNSIEPVDFANTDPDQVLTTDTNGIVVWANATSLTNVNTDASITGNGSIANPLEISATILDAIQANTTANTNETNRATAAEALKEDLINKSDDPTLGNSTTLYPTQNAVKLYVDNTVGGAVQTIVSGDANNAITASTLDGGAYYNDGDSEDTNELQNISFNPNTNELTISKPFSGTGVISLNTTTGVGTTEFADGITITGSGTTGDRFKIEPAALPLTVNQVLITDTTGNIDWIDIPTGATNSSIIVDPTKIGGAGVSLDPYTIALNAITSAEILNESILSEDILDGTITSNDISDGNVTPIKIQPATLPLTENKMLITDFTSGAVAWANIPSGGTSEDNQTDEEVLLATPSDYDNDPTTPENNVQQALNAIAAASTDDQTDEEVLLA